MAAISRFCIPLLVALVLLSTAAGAQAQIPTTKPYATLFLIRGVEMAGSPPQTLSAIVAAAPVEVPVAPPAVTAKQPRGRLLPALYGGFVTLQALDAHSTFRALDAGHVEQNPIMRWSTSRPVAFISMKAAATAGTVFFAEKIRKKHPKGAIAFITAVNAAYAIIVTHNYRAPVR